MLKLGNKAYAIDISKIMRWVSTTPQEERNILTTITQVQPLQTTDYGIDDEDVSIEVASKEITENKTTLNDTMNNVRYDLIKMILSELFTYTNNDGETRQHCVEPEHIKERIINSAKDILFLYDKL